MKPALLEARAILERLGQLSAHENIGACRADLIEAHRLIGDVLENRKTTRDETRMAWLCRFTEFRFRVYDTKEKRYLAEQHAQGVVIRQVIDAAMRKWPNP